MPFSTSRLSPRDAFCRRAPKTACSTMVRYGGWRVLAFQPSHSPWFARIAGGPTWLNLALWLSKHAELMGPCKPRYTYHELVVDLEPRRPMHRHPTSVGTDALICSHFDECLDACSEERLRVSSGHPAGQKISDPVLRVSSGHLAGQKISDPVLRVSSGHLAGQGTIAPCSGIL
jgi:hypothetical protein